MLLARCPFCGSNAAKIVVLPDSEGYRGQIAVVCACGGAFLGDEKLLDTETLADFSEDQARAVITGWNKREKSVPSISDFLIALIALKGRQMEYKDKHGKHVKREFLWVSDITDALIKNKGGR